MFLGMMKNEFIKLFSRLKTYIILILLIVLCALMIFIGHTNEKYSSQDYSIEYMESEIEWNKQYIEEVKTDQGFTEEEREERIRDHQEYLDDLESELKFMKMGVEGEYENSWREDYEMYITELEADMQGYPAKTDASKDERYAIAEIEQQIEEYKLLLSTNTSPRDAYKNTGANYLNLCIIGIVSGFLVFGLILFSGDSVSSEYNPGTFKVLLIQPVTRAKVLLSKYLVMALSSIGLILGVQGLSFLLVSLVKGFGNFSRPVLIGQEYERIVSFGREVIQQVPGSGQFVPLWSYLLRIILLEVILIITITAFTFMISTIAKSTVVSNTMCIAILIGSSIVYGMSTKYRKISHLICLHFGDVDGIVKGSIVQSTGSFSFTYPVVVIVSLVSTVIFLAVSIGIFKKRDLLI